ncbi:IS110 family transposase [Thermophilibacter sp. ET337]|uniref:IS110 family transposase n=1 Tax=Thermophilibacter sp. ET337 TaxID=2973084 RepID=UPI0021ACCF30|nr:IS110 family transposase [Thermophilibacter sp. ET337]MCR8908840.1 IS110 family transposase [Thermophilibacter sp. ET337]
MVSVGIDVAKDKHDCFILGEGGEVLADVFTVPNTQEGFSRLAERICSCRPEGEPVRVGLEATGHYSHNILEFLVGSGFDTFVLNPLSANLYRKSLTLRKTKTDRVDARNIAAMLLSGKGLEPYRGAERTIADLKSLTRYRFDKVRDRAKLKQSISRLVCILFPELEKMVPTLHMVSVYALLERYPGAAQVAGADPRELRALLDESSRHHCREGMAEDLRAAAASSIGSSMPAKSMELQHTIRLIRELGAEIGEVERSIRSIMDELDSPITTIPGVGYKMGAMIIAESGGLSRFESADKLLAYAGMSPSTYQSGQLKNCFPHMEKRGSRYLRYALYNATKYVCRWDPTFAAYLEKKRSEGKHYNVALSHATKKLVRVIFALERSRQPYRPAPPAEAAA